MPHSTFKNLWNMLIIILLIYTASYVPYRTAFIDDVSPEFEIFEYFVDALFICDLFVNFVSAYMDDDKNLETRPNVIAIQYLRSWFVFDAFACIPFQIFEKTQVEIAEEMESINNEQDGN